MPLETTPPNNDANPARDSQASQAPAQADAGEGLAGLPLPPFDPAALRWQMACDVMAERGMLIALLAAAALASVGSAAYGLFAVAPAFLVLLLSTRPAFASARAWQQLPLIQQLSEVDPAQAEARLAEWLRPGLRLKPTIRALLYHRLAALRHRMGRLDESIAIAQALLEQPQVRLDQLHPLPLAGAPQTAAGQAGPSLDGHGMLGGLATVRSNLLLMMGEAKLQMGDLAGAWMALTELHRGRVSLMESLQRLALQTRYEVMAGRPAAALAQWQRKAQMAELMPPDVGAATHAMLALAAGQAGAPQVAAWLKARALLLAPAPRLAELLGAQAMDRMRALPELG